MKRFAMISRAAWTFAALSLLFTFDEAAAVGTRTFRLDTLEELKGGDLEGASVDSQGRVRAGFVLGNLPIENAGSVWSSLVMADGSVLLGTGNEGKVLRVAGGQVSEYAATEQMAVTSLSLDADGKVLAGTMPNGKVFRIDGAGKVKELVTLPDTEHVWGLALDAKSKAVFAATGPNGKLFRIDRGGVAQVYFDSDEPHLLSLAVTRDGVAFTGSSGQAILFRVDAPGRATVVQDFPGDDVKAVALAPDGTLYAIANEHDSPPTLPRASRSEAAKPAEPAKPEKQRPKPGKGRLYRIDAQGRAEQLLYDAKTHFQSLDVGADGLPYVGAGAGGQVYAVDEAHVSMLMADTDERQVGALVVAGRSRFLATSDPVVFHEIRAVGGPDAVWTSKPLDAGLRARYGRMSWSTTGPVEFSTRTGNTEKPDETWSPWSGALGAPGLISSPKGQYLQIRCRFSRDPSAVVRDIVVYFVTDNARAVVSTVSVKGQAKDDVSQKKIPESGGDPPESSTKIKLEWEVDNPDQDELRYQLFYRFEDSTVWRPMLASDEVLTKHEYEWNTSGLPEGRYRVKVEATDELANPPAQVLRHANESGSILVDNTPPVFRQLAVNGRRIRGQVADGVGPIARIDVAVDPNLNLWVPLFPDDDVFDEPVESFDLDVGALLTRSPTLVAVRAVDEAGNVVVKTVDVR